MRKVGDDYVLRAGDTLEFLNPRGVKGTGHVYRSKAGIMQAFGLTEAIYKEWKDRGLPILENSDGTVFMTEHAFDHWFERTAGLRGLAKRPAEETDTLAENYPVGFVVSRERFSIESQGKTCPLGNSKVFCLAERLYRARGNYVSYGQLIADVWAGYQVGENSIHQAVKTLRRKLLAAGMTDIIILAQSGHYALKWP